MTLRQLMLIVAVSGMVLALPIIGWDLWRWVKFHDRNQVLDEVGRVPGVVSAKVTGWEEFVYNVTTIELVLRGPRCRSMILYYPHTGLLDPREGIKVHSMNGYQFVVLNRADGTEVPWMELASDRLPERALGVEVRHLGDLVESADRIIARIETREMAGRGIEFELSPDRVLKVVRKPPPTHAVAVGSGQLGTETPMADQAPHGHDPHSQ